MADLTTISQSVELAKAYYIELLDEDTSNRQNGCSVFNIKKVKCLGKLILALGWDIADNINDQVTEAIYSLLLNVIAPYAGNALSNNPNVIIPGRTVVIVDTFTPTPPFTKTQANLVLDTGAGQWYLPFLDNNGNQPINNVVPVVVVSNGISFTFQFDDTHMPNRIYGFGDNSPQNIVVYVTP